MAGRIRSIKPELLSDAKAARLSDTAWRCFVSCWLLADDYGRLAGDPLIVGGQIFPLKPAKAEQAIDELVAAEMLSRYVVRGQTYIAITNWAKHQRIDNAGKARCPAPEESSGCESPRVSANLGEPPLDPDPDRTPTPKGTPKGKARMRDLPSDWSPTDSSKAKAAELGLDLVGEADEFRGWTAAKGQQYADWDAAFENHLRRQAKRRAERPAAPTPRHFRVTGNEVYRDGEVKI